MRFVTVNSGQLVELDEWQRQRAATSRVSTEIPGFDGLFGCQGLSRATVHELLYPANSARPMFPAMLLAKAACGLPAQPPSPAPALLLGTAGLTYQPPDPQPEGVIVISDPNRLLYPPAAAQLGIPLSHLYLLHPKNREEELWAIAECLASAGVCAVVACLGKLSQVEARRLQLASERGRSMGLLLRPSGKVSSIYAASTRLLVTPQSSPTFSQRWRIQLLHGHGSQVGKSLILEYDRETHTLRTTDELAGQPAAAKTQAGHSRASVA